MRGVLVKYQSAKWGWVVSPVLDSIHIPVPARGAIVAGDNSGVGLALASFVVVAEPAGLDEPDGPRAGFAVVPMSQCRIVATIETGDSGVAVIKPQRLPHAD